jgi:hypothetical protein
VQSFIERQKWGRRMGKKVEEERERRKQRERGEMRRIFAF